MTPEGAAPLPPTAQRRAPSGLAAIEVRGVRLAFEDRPILDGLSLQVMAGERMVILGSSGGGKTTLLRVMLGVYPPDAGEVRVFGRNIAAIGEEELNALRRRWGVVFQNGALYNSMTVGENVALPLRENTQLDDNIISVMVRMKLDLVGMRDCEDLKPAQLSGGMAKRVGLARAIALDPEILFYDEPTTGLDPITAGAIMALVNDLAQKSGSTSVIVTQDMRCAFTCADRIALLWAGRVHALGSPEEIRSSADPLVRQFIAGEPDGPIPFRLGRGDFAGPLLGGPGQRPGPGRPAAPAEPPKARN